MKTDTPEQINKALYVALEELQRLKGLKPVECLEAKALRQERIDRIEIAIEARESVLQIMTAVLGYNPACPPIARSNSFA